MGEALIAPCQVEEMARAPGLSSQAEGGVKHALTHGTLAEGWVKDC